MFLDFFLFLFQVSNTLERAIKASNQQAFHYAAVVDKEVSVGLISSGMRNFQKFREILGFLQVLCRPVLFLDIFSLCKS